MEPSFYRNYSDAEDWDWWHAGRRRVLLAVLEHALASVDTGVTREGRRPDLLDVGCGTGGTTVALGRFARTWGCDVSQDALPHAARRGIERLVRAGAESLPFRDRSFDVVTALDVLEHHVDDLSVAREMRRVLRPGGLFIATVPAFRALWGPHDVISHHERRYVLPELRSLVQRAGLELRHATYFNAGIFPGVLVLQSVRRWLRGGRPPEPASDLPHRMPAFVNAGLREIFALESKWVPRHSLPFGVSALAVATAPLTPAAS